jgi:triacylglycerol lipase
MGWFTPHLLLLVLLGVIGVVWGFRFRRGSRARTLCIASGFLFLTIFLLGSAYVIYGPPGLEKTDKEQDRTEPIRPHDSHLERLTLSWNAAAVADWPAAETLALLCQIAYKTPVDAEDAYQKLGFQQVETFVDASMIGYVISAGDVAVVVFRGTDDRYDWFTNLNTLTTETPQGPIHSGFSQAYLPLKPQIVKLLDRRKSKHLWITGHSLGGALAVVCAYDLIENQRRVIDGVMTFGQPMVAGKQLADHLDRLLIGKHAHFVNESDIVPRIPPSLTHSGSLVWFTQGLVRRSKQRQMVFGSDGRDQATETLDGEIPPLSEREFEQAKANMRRSSEPKKLPDGTPIYEGGLPFINDHSIDLYLEKIRKIRRN